jgi:teichuronic acid biosynthesis glycosyltransferase TuaG
MPKVSVITPLFNGAGYIEQTILSVINQTFSDWEMIIVDDCSADQPETIISRYAGHDARIRFIRLDRNHGAAEARNIALDLACGDYIAFLDGDDTWKPEKLQRQTGMMEKNNWIFSFTAYEILEQDGKPAGKIVHVPVNIDYDHYLRNTIIGCLTVMIDRRKTGPFRMPLLKTSHDMALWLTLLKQGIVAHGIDEVLASYRVVLSSNTANKLKAASGVWHVYREIEKLPLLPALFNFAGYFYHAVKKRI